MKSLVLCVFVALCLCVFPASLPAQTTYLQGTVTRAGSRDPLSKATVDIRSDEPNAPLLNTITTEDDGVFLFQNLRPGRYRLSVTRQGYFRSPFGITIAAGQASPNIQLPISATGAIYGRVYGADGQPRGNLLVQAKKASYPEGKRVLTAVQNVMTNDLGEYRLFWLPPGRYYVAAIPPEAEPLDMRMSRGGGFGTMSIGGTNTILLSSATTDPTTATGMGLLPEDQPAADRYIPVYYSGTSDEQLASAIDVRPGSDFGGVNIVLAPTRERHVRGMIVDGATGKAAEYPSIEVVVLQPTMPRDKPEANRETGAFDLKLLPGTHTLMANSANGSGYATVHVGDTDVDNVVIRVAQGFDVTGRLTVEGRTGNSTDTEQLQLRLRNPAVPFRPTVPYSTPLPNGSFTLDGDIGDFRVNVAPILNIVPNNGRAKLPASLKNAYVKSIRMGNVDVLNQGLHLDKKPDLPLEIVLGLNPGAVAGTAGAADITVVLVPNLRSRTDLYQNTISDPSGRFRFDIVPPGDYKLFAWAEVENGIWFDAEFMRNSENRGTPVHVDEGLTISVNIQPD